MANRSSNQDSANNPNSSGKKSDSQSKQHQQEQALQHQQGDNSTNQGFAGMDPERQREVASEGGKAAHASGNAHEFTSKEAREAGAQSHKNNNNH